MQRAPEREFQKRNVYISRFGCFFLILDFVQWKEITNHGRSSGPWGVRGAMSWEDGPWSYKSHMFSLVVRSPSGAVVLYWKDAHMGLDFLRHNWGHVFLPSFWSIWNLFIQRVFCWAAWKKKKQKQATVARKVGWPLLEAFLAAHHSLTFLPFLCPLQGSKKREAFPTQKSVYYFYIQKRDKISRRENFPKWEVLKFWSVWETFVCHQMPLQDTGAVIVVRQLLPAPSDLKGNFWLPREVLVLLVC